MKIKDLKHDYPLIYEAALRNQQLSGNARNDELKLDIDWGRGNFNWHESSEGKSFWDNICLGKFIKAKKICPHLFELSDSELLKEAKRRFRLNDVVRNDNIVVSKQPFTITTHDRFNVETSYGSKIVRYRDDYGMYHTVYILGEWAKVTKKANEEYEYLWDCDGREFEAEIESKLVRGKITVEHGNVYLCQDSHDGDHCSDKKGYKYSWVITSSGKVKLSRHNVSNFRLIGEPYVSAGGDDIWVSNDDVTTVLTSGNNILVTKSDEGSRLINPFTFESVDPTLNLIENKQTSKLVTLK
jgi:hypothetical protein